MYWRTALFSLLILLSSIKTAAQYDVTLSEDAEISVMTMGPYQGELYSAFGHSAFHVKDSANKIDLVYNYGVFDFDQENFFWNFARGKMLYQLGLARYSRFRRAYEQENRYIIEQYLNLTWEEKQQFYNYLSNNYKPENREYYYNYVYDNCATKIRDVVEATFPDRVTFSYGYEQEGKTIRGLMDDYLTYQPWGDWIIDIGLGNQIDKEATPREYMFLPDYIFSAFKGATLFRDSVEVPLITRTEQVFVPEPEEHENGFFTPFNVFVVFFFVVGFITNRDFKKEKRTRWIDPVVFTLPGLLGWWLVFLWLGTDHLSENNYNLLWAIPFHLPLVYFLGVKKLWPVLSKYFLVISCLYVLLLVVWGILPQPMHNAIIPLVLTMVLRGFYIYFDLQKQMRKATLPVNGKR